MTGIDLWHQFCADANDLAAWDEADVAQGIGILLEDEWEMQLALETVAHFVKAGFTVNEMETVYREASAARKRGETSGVVELELSGPFAWVVPT